MFGPHLEDLDLIEYVIVDLLQVKYNIVVFGPHLEHLDLIEYVIVDLLQVKWKSFIKKSFYR